MLLYELLLVIFQGLCYYHYLLIIFFLVNTSEWLKLWQPKFNPVSSTAD